MPVTQGVKGSIWRCVQLKNLITKLFLFFSESSCMGINFITNIDRMRDPSCVAPFGSRLECVMPGAQSPMAWDNFLYSII